MTETLKNEQAKPVLASTDEHIKTLISGGHHKEAQGERSAPTVAHVEIEIESPPISPGETTGLVPKSDNPVAQADRVVEWLRASVADVINACELTRDALDRFASDEPSLREFTDRLAQRHIITPMDAKTRSAFFQAIKISQGRRAREHPSKRCHRCAAPTGLFDIV